MMEPAQREIWCKVLDPWVGSLMTFAMKIVTSYSVEILTSKPGHIFLDFYFMSDIFGVLP
jgi:hypothetical protein